MLGNIVGPPARGDDFYNREESVALLWDRLQEGHVMLAAPRRFGKTSLMYRLLDNPRAGWRPVHVDAQSIREPVNFVVALLDALVADQRLRRFLTAAWKKTTAGIRSLFEDLEVKGPWDVGVKIKLKQRLGEHWQERSEALLRELHDYDDGERLLIVVDELPVMLYLFSDNGVSDAEARAFLYWFRRIRTDPKAGLARCRFLVGGSIGIEGYLSALGAIDSCNDFERVPLGELSAANARGLLKALLRARRLQLSPTSQRKVLELVGVSIPYFLQVFVSEIANAKAHGTTVIGPKRLEEIYRGRILGASCKSYFQHYYDRLRWYDKPTEQAAKGVLKEVALAYPTPVARGHLRAVATKASSGIVDEEGFARLMGDLENDFYVRHDAGTHGYGFASKILCDWWRRYYAF